MLKRSKFLPVIALGVAVNLLGGASSAFASTYSTWNDLKTAITVGEGMGTFNVEPGAVLIATPDEYLYAGIFSGTLNGGTGDGIANINGLTRPLFESLREANVSGLQLTAAADDPGGDGDNGVTGRGILADTATDSTINNVRVGGEVNLDFNPSEAWRNVDNVGGLVGTATNVTITNSHFTGSVYADGSNVGGLVGNLQNSTISNSTAKSSIVIEGANNVGGLVGISSNSVINLAQTVGSIDASTAVGGIVGHATSTDITNSLSKSLINASGDSVGGIAGVLANDLGIISEINNSIFKGSILSQGDPGQVGGIVGLNFGTIENVSAQPMDIGITGDIRVGGLVGFNDTEGAVRNSFFDGKVVSLGSVGGIAGLNKGLIINSAANGDIYSDEVCVGDLAFGDLSCAGLIVGFNNTGTITNSISIVNRYALETTTNAADAYLPNTFPQHFLQYLNADVIPDLWEINSCYNAGRPFLSSIRSYVGSDCESLPEVRTIFELPYRPSLTTEIASTIKLIKGFDLATLLPSQAPLKIINKLSDIDLNQIIISSFDLNTNREIILQQQMPIQLALKGEVGSKAEVWLKTPTGEWIKLGKVEFDAEGNAILPALKFEDLGDYKISFFSTSDFDFTEVNPKDNIAIGSINLAIR